MSRRERQKRRARHRPHPAKRILLLTAGLGLSAIVVGVLAAVGWVAAVAASAPNINDITPRMPHPPSEIFAADGTPLGYVHADTVSDPLTGAQIPQMMRNATVAIEDRRFYQHGALDYQGILRAGLRDVFGGHSGLQGASTLTMQLVDNEYISSSLRAKRNLKYKIVQAKLAEELESRHSKTWILNSYLNDAPYGTVGGETARGVGAASVIFFNKPVDKLDLAQMALLAGLPQAPSEYNPFISPRLARVRRHQVIKAMLTASYITRAQAVTADHSPLQVHSGSPYTAAPRYPFVFDYIVRQLEARYGVSTVENGGLKVYTTLNPHDQNLAETAVDDHEGGAGSPAAALSSVDPTNGHILALAATESHNKTRFFYATQALRQPGSAFKVFALMTLIHDYHGNPNSTYYNSHLLNAGWDPHEPSWSVHTAEKTYQGSISLTQATIISDNTVYAQLVLDLGMPKFEAMARAMGVPGDQLNGDPAEVIGGLTNGVTTLTMSDAYATIANGGTYRAPTILSKVVFPNGRVANLAHPTGTKVFSTGETGAAINVLKQVVTNPNGTGVSANYGCPVAGKTGTAENLANAWFVGFSPRISTAVWVGYPQGNIGLGPNGFGGTLAAPIWRQYMASASNGYCGDFPAAPPVSLTAFHGSHATNGPLQNAGGNANSTGGSGYTNGYRYNNGNGYNTGNGYGGGGTGYGYGGTTGTGNYGYGGNTYSNPTLYAQPPAATTPGTRTTPGTTGATGTTGGTGGGPAH